MSASSSGRRDINSSSEREANSSGNRASTSMLSSSPNESPQNVRPRIMAFRATSVPDKSSRGSGSVKPSDLASATISLNLPPSSSALRIKPRVPLSWPSTFTSSSPESKSLSAVHITGRPAPQVASRPTILGRLVSVRNQSYFPVMGFLFAKAMGISRSRAGIRYGSGLSKAEQSAITGFSSFLKLSNASEGHEKLVASDTLMVARCSPAALAWLICPSASRENPFALEATKMDEESATSPTRRPTSAACLHSVRPTLPNPNTPKLADFTEAIST
mmetsp:Transcript_14474/g.25944  ORF Transcript_14474/g.25944 Transcript_14474/m.25944 type:complete len:275 (-) Transcript_14474:168-992(-)